MKRKDANNKCSDEELIINRPEALGRLRKSAELSITTLGWIVWFILFRPLFVAILWLMGVRLFYRHMFQLGGLHGLAQNLPVYISIILLIFLIIRSWNVYNKTKFGGKNRRVISRIVLSRDMEKFFDLPKGSAPDLWEAKDISVSFGEYHHFSIGGKEKGSSVFWKGYFRPS